MCKKHISSEQRDALLEIARIHTHKFTHEIRRELTNAKCRDLEVAEPLQMCLVFYVVSMYFLFC